MTSDIAQRRKRDDEAVAALVRQRDRDRYWSALFSSQPERAAILALYAFHAELDRVLALVAEPLVGEIRLQWWRDAVENEAPDASAGHPVADALSTAIARYSLPRDRLIAMIDARVPLMFGEPPLDEKAFKSSLRDIEGAVFELAAAILGDRSDAAKTAAAHAGVAYGVTDVLLNLPYSAARQKAILPTLYLASRGIDLAAIARGETNANFEAALADLRGVALRALHDFRAAAPDLNRAAWLAFLPLALVKPYLKAMAMPQVDPLHTVVAINPLSRFWRIWQAAQRKTL